MTQGALNRINHERKTAVREECAAIMAAAAEPSTVAEAQDMRDAAIRESRQIEDKFGKTPKGPMRAWLKE